MIDESLNRLIEAIKNSEEFHTYQVLQEKIKMEPESEAAINKFRRHNYELQRSKNTDLFEENDQIWYEYETLRMQPLAEEFLKAEMALCRIFQKVNLKMVQSLQFDLNFLEE